MKSIEQMKMEKLDALRNALDKPGLTLDSPEWGDGDGLTDDDDEASLNAAWDRIVEEDDDDDLEVEGYINPDFPEETPNGKTQ